MEVDPSNVEQAKAWDGDEGEYWARHAERFDTSLATYEGAFFGAAAVGAGDRVLDVGCGAGSTTRVAARAASSGSALGVDLSSPMIGLARRLATAEGVGNVEFVQADAQVHPFDAGAFDVAISRTGSMFFGDPVAAFTNIGRALGAGGRLVLLTWQPLEGNEWLREISGALAAGRDRPAPPPDAPGPFALSDPDRVHRVLTGAGFTGVDVRPETGPMRFGKDADDAHAFLTGLLGWMLEGLDEAGRAGALDALHASLSDHQTDEGVAYGSAAWIVTARRP